MFAQKQMVSNIPSEAESSQAPTPADDHTSQEENETPSFTITPGNLLQSTISGHQVFKSVARFTDVKIVGGMAIGQPGCMDSIDVQANIISNLSSKISNDNDYKMAKAVSKVLGDHLQQYANGIIVPNQMWYPAYSFMLGPVAPPIPNIPTPLAALPSFNEYLLTNEHIIRMEILGELPSQLRTKEAEHIIDSFCGIATDYFENWIHSQLIMNVLGSGNVPAFAPPFSPGGPVIGKVLPIPGVLS